VKKLLLAALLIGTAVLFAQVNSPAGTSGVEVHFTYTRQGGFASNQFAVWVEDAQGRHVKTLYATRYTAAGGWQRREHSLPLWVKQSNLPNLNRSQIDAFSGPTPRSGAMSYSWDGTDSAGRAVPPGEYRVFVEGTLRNENRVLYTAIVKLGEHGQATVQTQYFGSSTAERGMIDQVRVTY
jgi:hypothetical protein